MKIENEFFSGLHKTEQKVSDIFATKVKEMGEQMMLREGYSI